MEDMIVEDFSGRPSVQVGLGGGVAVRKIGRVGARTEESGLAGKEPTGINLAFLVPVLVYADKSGGLNSAATLEVVTGGVERTHVVDNVGVAPYTRTQRREIMSALKKYPETEMLNFFGALGRCADSDTIIGVAFVCERERGQSASERRTDESRPARRVSSSSKAR